MTMIDGAVGTDGSIALDEGVVWAATSWPTARQQPVDTGVTTEAGETGAMTGVSETGVSETDEAPLRSSFARCADGYGTLTHLFFSDDEFDIARAKAICSKCGLAEQCLSGALERVEPYGVWGGKLVIDGEIVEVKRGRGRPPKHPRPPLVVDEVPLPPHLVA